MIIVNAIAAPSQQHSHNSIWAIHPSLRQSMAAGQAQQYRIHKDFTPEARQWLAVRKNDPSIDEYNKTLNGCGDHIFRQRENDLPVPPPSTADTIGDVEAAANTFNNSDPYLINDNRTSVRLDDQYRALYEWIGWDNTPGVSIATIDGQVSFLQINIVPSDEQNLQWHKSKKLPEGGKNGGKASGMKSSPKACWPLFSRFIKQKNKK